MSRSYLLFIVTLCFFSVEAGYADDSLYIHGTAGTSDSVPRNYAPPLIGNGSINLQVDFQGVQKQQAYIEMVPGIYKAGRRYGPPGGKLIPFGFFDQEITIEGEVYDTPARWEQQLNTLQAYTAMENIYGDEVSVHTTAFVHALHDVIVVKKRFTTTAPDSRTIDYAFKYHFVAPGGNNAPPYRVVSENGYDRSANAIRYDYQADGYPMSEGVITLFSQNKDINYTVNGQDAELQAQFTISKGKSYEVVYYIVFSDSIDGEDYRGNAESLVSDIGENGYLWFFDSHASAWKEYWSDYDVSIPDKTLHKVYNTAQYHLKTNATKWSSPVGLFPTHWGGRYFAWDEMYCFQALASSNHLSLSQRTPAFRKNTLENALYRVAHYGSPGTYGARYPWEAMEDGVEAAPQRYGFWIDHVFHISHVALSSWQQYQYSGDAVYLRETGFPVIKECARFFVTHMIYENEDGSMFIGKTTDLERLGPAIENPFMTASGAIYTLEAAAEAAKLLQQDVSEAARWQAMALKLRESLPHEGGRYVPYAGCEERSVAALAGFYPYPIFDADHDMQRAAVYDFLENGQESGNMYPVGSGLSAWYGGWLVSALAVMNEGEEAYLTMQKVAQGAGHFAELFEINEPAVTMKPWFSTASGNYIYALNQMLLRCHESTIHIVPATPASWKTLSFDLPCYGNVVASITMENGRIVKALFTAGNAGEVIKRTVTIPRDLVKREALRQNDRVKFLGENDGKYVLEVTFTGDISLI